MAASKLRLAQLPERAEKFMEGRAAGRWVPLSNYA